MKIAKIKDGIKTLLLLPKPRQRSISKTPITESRIAEMGNAKVCEKISAGNVRHKSTTAVIIRFNITKPFFARSNTAEPTVPP